MRSVTWCAVAIFVSLCASAQQELPELLIPVDREISAKFDEKSSLGLRQTLYFAKRHRIVRVDFDLLDEPGATFTITAFPGASLTVQAVDLATSAPDVHNRQWKGEILEPRSEWVSLTDDTDPKLLEEVFNTISLLIFDGPREVPAEVFEELRATSSAHPVLSDRPRDAAGATGNPTSFKIQLPTLSSRWFQPELPAHIVITPIDEDPRFHVVYEQDESKVPQGSDFRERLRRIDGF